MPVNAPSESNSCRFAPPCANDREVQARMRVALGCLKDTLAEHKFKPKTPAKSFAGGGPPDGPFPPASFTIPN